MPKLNAPPVPEGEPAEEPVYWDNSEAREPRDFGDEPALALAELLRKAPSRSEAARFKRVAAYIDAGFTPNEALKAAGYVTAAQYWATFVGRPRTYVDFALNLIQHHEPAERLRIERELRRAVDQGVRWNEVRFVEGELDTILLLLWLLRSPEYAADLVPDGLREFIERARDGITEPEPQQGVKHTADEVGAADDPRIEAALEWLTQEGKKAHPRKLKRDDRSLFEASGVPWRVYIETFKRLPTEFRYSRGRHK